MIYMCVNDLQWYNAWADGWVNEMMTCLQLWNLNQIYTENAFENGVRQILASMPIGGPVSAD